MKKYIPYLLLAVVGIIVILAWKPWENTRPGEEETEETTEEVTQKGYLPSDEIEQKSSGKPAVCIYMENSGSMDGYVNLNSEFKDALGKVIVKSNNSYNTQLYFVNNAIYDVQETQLRGDVNNFVSQLNSSTMKIGSTGSSNINKIFSMVLDKTNKDTVSVLFSDFVYSIQGTDVSDQVANAKNATMGAFLKALKNNPNFATIILQCQSKFQGKYYNRNDNPVSYNGNRPYYIFIMGDYDKLMEIDKKLELNRSQTGIPGLLNKYMLSSKTWNLNEETVQVLTTSYTSSDLIKPEHNGMDIDFIKYDKSDGSVSFAYAFGVNNLFVDGSYLTDVSNYEIDPSGVKVIKAEYTTDEAALNEVNQFKHPYVLQLLIDNSTLTKNLKIRLINKLPKWVRNASVEDDLSGVPEETKTFAIASLLEGVYEAFASQTEHKPIFEFETIINEYKK